MKLVVFSEEQQEFCFLDNTLTPYESCVDLLDYEIGNASIVSASSQPNKIWVFDQLNSRLHLLSLSSPEQSQEIENIRGMLNSKQLTSMIENNSLLYLLDPAQGVFILDLYGSLVNTVKEKDVRSFQMDDKYLYLLIKGGISIINLETLEKMVITLPIDNIKEFKKSENNYYFRSNNKILKYQLILIE